MCKQITLKQDTDFSTGYRGRGMPTRGITVPAGTVVEYRVRTLFDGRGLETGRVHTVFIIRDGMQFEAEKTEVLKAAGASAECPWYTPCPPLTNDQRAAFAAADKRAADAFLRYDARQATRADAQERGF